MSVATILIISTLLLHSLSYGKPIENDNSPKESVINPAEIDEGKATGTEEKEIDLEVNPGQNEEMQWNDMKNKGEGFEPELHHDHENHEKGEFTRQKRTFKKKGGGCGCNRCCGKR